MKDRSVVEGLSMTEGPKGSTVEGPTVEGPKGPTVEGPSTCIRSKRAYCGRAFYMYKVQEGLL